MINDELWNSHNFIETLSKKFPDNVQSKELFQGTAFMLFLASYHILTEKMYVCKYTEKNLVYLCFTALN